MGLWPPTAFFAKEVGRDGVKVCNRRSFRFIG